MKIKRYIFLTLLISLFYSLSSFALSISFTYNNNEEVISFNTDEIYIIKTQVKNGDKYDDFMYFGSFDSNATYTWYKEKTNETFTNKMPQYHKINDDKNIYFHVINLIGFEIKGDFIELGKIDKQSLLIPTIDNYISEHPVPNYDSISETSNGTHSKDIGTLQNVAYKHLVVAQNDRTKGTQNHHKYTFAQKTTTGIDLKEDRYVIQYMFMSQNRKNAHWYNFKPDYEKMGDTISLNSNGERSKILTDSSHSLSISIEEEEMKNLLPESKEEYESINFMYRLHWGFYTFIRVYDTETKTYGTWSRIKIENAKSINDALSGDIPIENTEVDFLDDEGNVISGGSTENGYSAHDAGSINTHNGNTTIGSGSIGSGYSVEDAEQGADSGHTINFDANQFKDASTYIDNVNELGNSLLEYIGNVPAILSAVFSFLPSWIIGFIALSIGITLILGIIKTLWS